MTKSELQEKIITKYMTELPSRGTIILPTGVGKTRVALQIVENLFAKKLIKSCLVVTPTTVLKDDSWPAEIKLLNLQELNITIECKQTAYKFKDKYDIVVIDEVHSALSSVHGKVLNIPCTYMLGLTATLPEHDEDHLEILKKRLPVFFSISLKECVEQGIVPSFKVFNLKVKLNKKERAKYSIYDKMFNQATAELQTYKNKIPEYNELSVFDLAQKASSIKTHPLHKIGKSYWLAMSMRKWECYRAESKLETTIEIIKKYPDKKWIVFSKEIKFVEELTQKLLDIKINALKYHSQMKDIDRKLVLELISKPKYKVLVSAEALNVGYNLPDLDAAICASGVSTELVGIQMVGRINRYKKGKIPVMINLVCDNTQEMNWVSKRTENMSPIWTDNLNKINLTKW